MSARERHPEVQPGRVAGTRPARLGLLAVLFALVASGEVGCSGRDSHTHTLVIQRSSWSMSRSRLQSLLYMDLQSVFRDSVVCRPEPGTPIGRLPEVRQWWWAKPMDTLSLGATAPDGRVWLRLRGALNVLDERGFEKWGPPQDSVLLGSEPVLLTTRTVDAGALYALRIRRGAPGPRHPSRRVTLRGMVRSKWTGERLSSQVPWSYRGKTQGFTALVTIAFGDTFALADSTGAFELRGVPEGPIRINATGLSERGMFGTKIVTAPDDSVVLFVDVDEARLASYREPPPTRIPVDTSTPGVRVAQRNFPHRIRGRLEWLLGEWEGQMVSVAGSLQGNADHQPICCEFLKNGADSTLRLTIRDASSPEPRILAEQTIRIRRTSEGITLWGIYEALGTHWRFHADGDSLVGLELDAPGGEPVRRLHAHYKKWPTHSHRAVVGGEVNSGIPTE